MNIWTMFRDLPIKRKLTVVIMATVVAALTLATAAFMAYDMITFRSQAVDATQSTAQIIGLNSRAALTFDDPKAATEMLAALSVLPNIHAACIYTEKGRIFAAFTRPGAMVEFPAAPPGEGFRFLDSKLIVVDNIELMDRRIGTIYVLRDMSEMYDRVKLYAGISTLVLLGSLGAAFFLSSILQRIISRPVQELVRTARTVAETKDYSRRLEKASADELGMIADGFNDMLAQIQARDTALLESRQRLEIHIQNTPLGVIIWDLDFRILEWNKSAERIFGYTENEAKGKTGHLILPEGIWKEQLAPVWQALLTRQGGRQMTNPNITKDGRTIMCEWYNTTLVDISGKMVGVASLVNDITASKEAEEKLFKLNAELEERVLERTVSLEAANKELEAFSYSASHDLRAPLRAIDGFSRIVRERYEDKLDEAGRNYLARVCDATQRMGRLIDDMLMLSRVTRKELRSEHVNLSAIAEYVAADLRQREPQRRVEFVIAPAAETQGDESLLRIVLENLIGNAWKFTGTRELARIEFGVLAAADKPIYFVRDNGVGFDMAYGDKLFHPFQRLHSTSEFPGTGIGLATVHRIVQRHGGKIWAEGFVNGGATFFFTI